MKKKQSVKLTKFQWKVLAATLKIPLGETRTYQWVAEQIGSPKAVRAVGQALKKNPYPVTIPCHRIIRKNGSLGGYAGGWGDRKAELLELEREAAKHIRPDKAKGRRGDRFVGGPGKNVPKPVKMLRKGYL